MSNANETEGQESDPSICAEMAASGGMIDRPRGDSYFQSDCYLMRGVIGYLLVMAKGGLGCLASGINLE